MRRFRLELYRQCGGAISSEVKRNSRARSLHNRFLSCRVSIVNPTLEPTATSQPSTRPPLPCERTRELVN